jgi:hypothetical protein
VEKREILAKLLIADPGKSNRQVAKAAGVHHETVAAVRGDLEANGEIRHCTERTEASGRKARGRKAGLKRVTPHPRPELAFKQDSLVEVLAGRREDYVRPGRGVWSGRQARSARSVVGGNIVRRLLPRLALPPRLDDGSLNLGM